MAMTNTHTISADDVRRWYTGPWCPKCGFVLLGLKDAGEKPELCAQCARVLKPGLHERWTETRLQDTLEFYLHEHPTFVVQEVADLCLAAVVRAVGVRWFSAEIVGTVRGDQWRVHIGQVSATAPTIHEAAAIAAHRYLDAQPPNRHLSNRRYLG